MAQQVVPPIVTAKLFIGELDKSASERDLHTAFSKYVSINFINIYRDFKRESRGFAIIEFTDPAEAKRARSEMNGEVVKDRRIRVADFTREYKSNPNANVFVKHFPAGVSSKDLEGYFSDVGRIISAKVVYDSEGRSRRYGFIQFDSVESADKAVELKNGLKWKEDEEDAMRVEKFLTRDKREDLFSNKNNLYVRGFNLGVRKEEFESLFKQFGEITSFTVQESEYHGEKKAYGYVNFQEATSAAAAMTALDGQETPLGHLVVRMHMSKYARVQFLRAEHKKKQEKWRQTNLVFNKLHPNVTESQLKALCAPYGVITSVKINMLDNFKFDGDSPVNEKISTGIGFVNFETAESAAKAQTELNRKEIEGKVVFVSHWVPKEELLRKFKVPHLRNKMMMNEFPQMFPTRMPMMGGPPMGGRPNRPMQTDPRKRNGPPHYQSAQPSIPNPRPAPQNSQGPKLIPVSSNPVPAPAISVSKLQEIIDKLPDLRTKKQTLGEFIYPRIMALTNQTIAGKVTGMLLEMEIPALIKFGEDVGLLRTRVGEALDVLRKAWTADENQRQYLPLLTLKDA